MTSAVTGKVDPLVLEPKARELLFTEARTANTFTDEPVTSDQLQAVYELTKWAPTSANTQPLRVLYVSKGQARERLLPHMAEGNREKTRSAPVVAVLAADTEFHEHIPTVFPIAPHFKDMFDADPDGRVAHAKFNATLQAGYFLLGVRAAGLAAGPMSGFDPAGVDQEFFADGRWRSILVVNIGYPGDNAWFDRLPRLDYQQVTQHL
ncbi:MAG TPA: malonic semialdehyde reductase [Pseudonocardia sp.]|jgi:3-hydroxypropanoate dehydrogenase|uniref:malonic semialdehyde reductase n=1 Tax=Pseudonocardia sp. TaxID=60912 RepID=UPI002F4182B2